MWRAADAASGAADAASGAADGGRAVAAPGGVAARAGLLVALIALADLLVWQVAAPRLSLAVLALALTGAAQAAAGWRGNRRANMAVWGGLVLGLLPVIEEVQALSLGLLALAMGHAFGRIALAGEGAFGAACRAALRLPASGLRQDWRDGRAALRALAGRQVDRGADGGVALALAGRFLRDWGIAAGLGAVFLALFAAANPVLDGWLIDLAGWSPRLDLAPGRLVFWSVMAGLIWPLLRLTIMAPALATPGTRTRRVTWPLPDDRAVVRALVTFNLMFAVQGGLDLLYLGGGAELPAGMTYAAYAHRGAYPLLATALLAGGFALLAQPYLAGRPVLRILLLVWVAQNVGLVAASLLRLDLYVEAYGLTRMRFAACLWMGLVAAGLSLMLVQVLTRRSMAWLTLRSAVLAALTLWLCAFVNVAGLVAGHNLSRADLVQDPAYLCGLGPGAAPAIAAHEATTGRTFCSDVPGPRVRAPADWREWGYRNARLRRSLSEIRDEVRR